ncbi:YciE/YciF ferroxidase family protein [Roseovarius sp. D0-M9]|uniref:YciE/YciF ferroxidase family protein n=1 Tax=Roseovarius sp. D0-M9 TaxID=3127117 RepID=UPI00300FBA8B
MYLKELQELQSAERQLSDAFSRMQELATDDSLKLAITNHLDETQSQLDRLDIMLKDHGADPDLHEDQSMSALIVESEKWVQMLEDATLRDAGLIASLQKIEHYQIAAYGTLACWAKHLDLDEDLDVLLGILDQDKTFDEELSKLAKRDVNPDALQ